MVASGTRIGSIADSSLRRRVRAYQSRELLKQTRRKTLRWNTRWLSGLIIIFISLILIQFVVSPTFYVSAIILDGVSYFSHEEMLGLIGAARTNVFWLDPSKIRERLLQQPGIEAATVRLGWPVGNMQISITEKKPIFAWQVGEKLVWVSEDGKIMPEYLRNMSLPLIVSSSNHPGQLTNDTEFNSSLVNDVKSFLNLNQGLAVTSLLFDPSPFRGIGQWFGEGLFVWYGRGGNYGQKANLVNAIMETAKQEGVLLTEINVAQPSSYYYRTSAGE